MVLPRIYVQEHISKEDLLTKLPKYRWMFLLAAFTVKMTVAAIERRHATHRTFSMPFVLGSNAEP